jgi:protein phosphatase
MEILSSFDSKPASSFLCAVADGVGGSQKGEVASKLALQTLAVRASEFLLGPARKEISRALGTSIEHANEVLVNYGMSHSESEGLATTIVASIIDGKTAYLAHAGDSRAYLINRAEVKQLTKDHSQVQEFVDAGKIKPEQARHYPGRNVITRAVGAATDIEVSTSSVPVSHGDQLLLCTDGLWEPVTDVEMQKIVLESDPQKACSKLVSLANERGGKDNATIVIVQIHDPVNMKPL